MIESSPFFSVYLLKCTYIFGFGLFLIYNIYTLHCYIVLTAICQATINIHLSYHLLSILAVSWREWRHTHSLCWRCMQRFCDTGVSSCIILFLFIYSCLSQQTSTPTYLQPTDLQCLDLQTSRPPDLQPPASINKLYNSTN